MGIQERLEAFWSGERPDQIPYTIYRGEWLRTSHDPAWQKMFECGLGVTVHISPFRAETRDLEIIDEVYHENGETIQRQTLRTPVGESWQTWVKGWHREYLLKTRQDYRVMTFIVNNTTLFPQYDVFFATQREIQPYGIALSAIGRTPLQTILVDYAGLTNFSYHLYDHEQEVRELYDALLKQFRRRVEITARGPGRFVSNLENFTADSLGPRRFKEFLLPVYQEFFPILQDAGKIVGSHLDGRTASCKDLIAVAPIDLIESLTEPNEGDQTLAECRAVWPDKLFWCNIRVGDYQLPPKQLRQKVLAMVDAGAPDGRRLAFEVSEHLPENWQESMPVVLAALQETRVS